MAELPEWSVFDANAAPVLPEHADRPGRLVVVVATTKAQEDSWAINATVDIAKSWSEAGRRVVLADTVLGAPTLHECLQTDNTEGVTDTVLFGSSVRHVAKQTDLGGFFFITAGTAAADPAAVLASERWARVSRGFVEAGVTLVTYIGSKSDGKSVLLDMATDVVLLVRSTEDAWSALDGTPAPIRAVMGPAATTSSDMPPLDDMAGALDPLEAVEEEEVDDDFAEPAHPAPEATIIGASRAGSAPAAHGSRRSALLVLILLSLGIVGAASLGWVQIPGISPERTSPPVEQGLTPAPRSTLPTVTTTTLAYSVAIGSFQDPDVAATRAAAISGMPGILLSVVPVMIDGTVFYRLLAGPAVDSASAEELADRIAAETGADRTGWLVRETPLAFLLEQTADIGSATARIDELRGLDVPAYLLAVDFSDGGTAYRVYAGAYADEREASYLLTHLETQGLDNATLSPRRGRLP